jgi:hypothetical protein
VAELAPGTLPPAVLGYPFRAMPPPDVDGMLRRTIGIALETLDHSPNDAGMPAYEANMPA